MSTPLPPPRPGTSRLPSPSPPWPSRHTAVTNAKRGEPRSCPNTPYPAAPSRISYTVQDPTHLCAVGPNRAPRDINSPPNRPRQKNNRPRPPSTTTHNTHTRSLSELARIKVQTPEGKLAGSGTGVVPCNSLPLPAARAAAAAADHSHPNNRPGSIVSCPSASPALHHCDVGCYKGALAPFQFSTHTSGWLDGLTSACNLQSQAIAAIAAIP